MLKQDTAILRRAIDIGALLPGEGPLSIAVTLVLPPADRLTSPVTALYCLPGGGVNRGFFDLAGEFSFARALAKQGFIVASFDPIGVGESTRPKDGFALTSDIVMRCHAEATNAVTAQLRDGSLSPDLPRLPHIRRIGVGHSLGAMVTILQQVEHRDYDALILLCFGTCGMPQVLTDEEREALKAPDRGRSSLTDLARIRFQGDAYSRVPRPPGASAASRALAVVQDRVLAVPSMQAIMPGNVAPEAARLDVPLFLGVGENDIVGPPHALPAEYPASQDITLHIVVGAGHHPFVAKGAEALFDRVGGWLRALL